MTDREAFIVAIAANPADDTPRLVFADWLDEHGESARAGFIRDQVHLAKLRPGSDDYPVLFRRTADTLRANLPAWIQEVCEAFGQPAEWKPDKPSGHRLSVHLGYVSREQFLQGKQSGLAQVEFSRGFIGRAEVRLPLLDSAEPLDRFLKEHPVTRLSTVFPTHRDRWKVGDSERLVQVRNLTLWGQPSEESASAVLNDDVWKGVTKLSLLTSLLPVLRTLCSSPLAKQLTGLRISHSAEELSALAQYPLDDRLQEFVISSAPRLVAPQRSVFRFRTDFRALVDLPDWSTLSQVAFRPTLKRLDLTGCTLGDHGLATFARGDVWIRLKALVLDRNRFGDPGWRDFVRSHRTPELKLLSASRNFVTNDGADRLGRSSLVETLEYVDLRGNRIDGKGAVSLARSLAGGPLKKLLLAGNPIRESDARAVRLVLGNRVDGGG